jgi:hypothetical protein
MVGGVLLVAGASVREMSWSCSWSCSWSESGRVVGTVGEDGGDSNSGLDLDLDFDLDFGLDSDSFVGVSCAASRPSSRLALMCFRFLLEVLCAESACFRFFVLCDGLCSSFRRGRNGDCGSSIGHCPPKCSVIRDGALECEAQLFIVECRILGGIGGCGSTTASSQSSFKLQASLESLSSR